MKEKVLVLGGTGHIGARLCAQLRATDWATPVAASSRGGAEVLRLDARDESALTLALREVQAVVNCVAGDAGAIAGGAAVLARAARAAGCRRVVHLSTMSVYGAQEGLVAEDAPLDPGLGWYGRAKVLAEAQLQPLVDDGASLTVLRPGCVAGPGSWLWVARIARLLSSGRLGDLGAQGDGWSNLVHVDDVCQAVVRALRAPAHPGERRVYNLAAPDSPRWNTYFCDLALAIGATPLRRVGGRRLRLDAWLGGPPLHVGRKLVTRFGGCPETVPPAITPGLLGLWQRQLHLDASAASRELGVEWTPYPRSVQAGAAWWSGADRSEPAVVAFPSRSP